jgi:CheY-like chemotaxis protein
MSLSGRLQDLHVLDILQLVSFSKRNGRLVVRSVGGLGQIWFRGGLVIAAEAPSALPMAAEVGVQDRVAAAVEHLAHVREGSFDFELVPTPEQVPDLPPEVIEGGLNTQGLILDLARGFDESRRHTAAAVEASFADGGPVAREPQEGLVPGEEGPSPGADASPFAPAGTPAAGPPPPGGALVLVVDDDAEVRRILSSGLIEAGLGVLEAAGMTDAERQVRGLSEHGTPLVVLCDLQMPGADGAPGAGGFELVRRLGESGRRPPVVMMVEAVSVAERSRLEALDVEHVVFKPALSALDPEQARADLAAFALKLARDILPRFGAGPDPGAGAAPSHGPEGDAGLGPYEEELVRLAAQGDAIAITGLILRAASVVFERAAVFLVKDEALVGLGGFGRSPGPETLNLRIRGLALPLAGDSPFVEVLAAVLGKRQPFLGDPPEDRWSRALWERLGRFRSRGLALLPLVSGRSTIALLCADNPVTGTLPDGPGSRLLRFLGEAGAALAECFRPGRGRAS